MRFLVYTFDIPSSNVIGEYEKFGRSFYFLFYYKKICCFFSGQVFLSKLFQTRSIKVYFVDQCMLF